MKWDKDAKQVQEQIPIPPMMSSIARLQSEKIARHKGLDRVTVEIVKETERMYRDFMGEEKTRELKAFLAGEGPAPSMEEELFFDNEEVLYSIDVCFTKYGENTPEVRNIIKGMMRSVKAVLEEEKVNEIIADLAPIALHAGHRFNVVLTGCPNCCVSPYLKDFGITIQHRVDITDAECTQCGECLKMCFDKAIKLTNQGPVIDRKVCAMCELCARDCPTGKLVTGARGFRVIAGGSGARQPKIAETIENFTTKERTITILKNAIGKLRKAKPGETLRDIIDREGPEALR